jgi:outer membrane receptor protein involved in Fe transport
MTKRFSLFRTVAAATVITGLAPAAALAQQAAAAPAASDEDDTIVVTARKREEALQDVPISVTAFNATAIEDRNIQNTTDLAAFTPGFAFSEGFGRDGDRPVIRGTSNILVGDGKVGTFIDGAPILGDTSAIDLGSVSRVEIIRGPQSAVFGRGTLSGAINYVSREPTNEAAFKVEGTYGNYGRADFFASASGPIPIPLGIDLRGYASYKTYNFDGDYNNALQPNVRLGAQSSENINVALFSDLTEDLRVNLRYQEAQDRDGHYAIRLQPASANNCFLTTRPTFCGTVQLPDRFEINTDQILRPGLARDTNRGILTVDWDVADTGLSAHYQATSGRQEEVSGYDQSYDSRNFFLSPAFAACAVPSANRVCGKTNFNDTDGSVESYTTHEVRLEYGTDNLPFTARIGYFTLERARRRDFNFLELTANGPDGAGTRTAAFNRAFFGGVDWDVTDALKLGLEVRYQEDKVSQRNLTYQVGTYFPASTPGVLSYNPNNFVDSVGTQSAVAPNPDGRIAKFDATLPRVTVDYRVNDDVLLFGQYAKGNSPGGFNSSTAPDPFKTFAEEELTNYEAGIKTSLFGFDYLNLTAFLMQYNDQVLSTNVLILNSSGVITGQTSVNYNIGEQEIRGFEFEASRELFEGLSATGTLSLVDGEFTAGSDPQQALFVGGSYCTTNPVTATTATIEQTTPAVTAGGVPTNTSCKVLGSIVGKQSPLVPPIQASLGLRYERPFMGDTNFFIGGDITYRDSFYAQVDNLQETGSATKVNAQFGLEGNHLKLTVWGKNLTNEDTPEGILRYVDFNAAPPPNPPGFQGTTRAFAIAAPRKPSVGLTLSYNW